MRSRADRATIGVSCGHRVPREPELVDGRKLYWCSTCAEHRMSGGSSNGVGAFDFLLELRDSIAANDVPIIVADPGTARGRAIVRALGASIGGNAFGNKVGNHGARDDAKPTSGDAAGITEGMRAEAS